MTFIIKSIGSSKDVSARRTDGVLMTASVEIHMCQSCDSAHVILLGNDSEEFAVALIGPNEFRAMGAWFIPAAADHDIKTGKKVTS